MKVLSLTIILIWASLPQAHSNPEQKPEDALIASIEASLIGRDYAEAEKQAVQFIQQFPKSSKVAVARYHHAQALDDQGRKNDAIVAYPKIWLMNMGRIQLSVPAMKRYMQLLWERNKPAAGNGPSDRQGAYRAGAKFIELTRPLREQMTERELEGWLEVEELVKTMEDHEDITPMSKLNAKTKK